MNKMKASIIDLRYKSKEILKALASNENVEILYHGKLKGTIYPATSLSTIKVTDHPFFNMSKNAKNSDKQELDSVQKEIDKLREPRYVV